ncbi:MAG: hypothetical protein KDK25_06080 [Leptospiraceae bacterium]|nr:hypothetical protein [Leptospiraceae bacterium]
MKQQMTKENLLKAGLILGMIAFAVVGRIAPHPANFAPIAALGMLGGYLFASRKYGLAVVMTGMLVSDLIIGAESIEMRLAVYGGLMVAVLAGGFLRSAKESRSFFLGLPVASAGSSLAFFAISNLAVWAFSGMYTLSVDGMILCYVNAIPFFWNTLAGDLIYSGMLLGAVRLAQIYLDRDVVLTRA